jgi:hypothetical protein
VQLRDLDHAHGRLEYRLVVVAPRPVGRYRLVTKPQVFVAERDSERISGYWTFRGLNCRLLVDAAQTSNGKRSVARASALAGWV